MNIGLRKIESTIGWVAKRKNDWMQKMNLVHRRKGHLHPSKLLLANNIEVDFVVHLFAMHWLDCFACKS